MAVWLVLCVVKAKPFLVEASNSAEGKGQG